MKKSFIWLTAVFFALISCVPTQAPAPSTREPEAKTAVKPAAQEGWESDWQKTIAAARREGGLTINSSFGPEQRQAMGQAFKDKFGLDVDWGVGTTPLIVAKLLRERAAGLYLADLQTGGPQNLNDLKPAGALDPIKPLLALPEVLDEKVWHGGRLPFMDKEFYGLSPSRAISGHVTINTTMVTPEEITSYNNFLEPRWKGKIVFRDPTSGGAAFDVFRAISGTMGLDYWRKFVQNSPVILRDERMVVEWVARGIYPILLGGKSDIVVEYANAGAPLKRVMPIYAVVTPIFYVNRAPHPNAAKLYVNWLLSKEGAALWSRVHIRQSARVDVPADHIAPEDRIQPGVKYFETFTQEYLSTATSALAEAKEVFAPLLK
ncbi:MAG: extracellular solute-binding protein [Chloroflexi bacterium]|nr:extracellular solute-binding protein [Chloroflexota bacterium]